MEQSGQEPSGSYKRAVDRAFGERIWLGQKTHESRRKQGRPPIYDLEHFREVARVYSEAEWLGQPPTKTVADRWKVQLSTAAKWVSRARHEFSLLPATQKGKAWGSRDKENR
jgi:hypothetical protein